ncbi:HAD family hydrolase [Candidatus Woesearchaeota archaeon]|nr:HAD family hydrolase [Candidatus Woesearchaeota archaeon]
MDPDGLPVIRLLLSDWSGVISDDRKPVFEAANRALEELGARPVSWDYLWGSTLGSFAQFAARELSAAGRKVPTLEQLYAAFERSYNAVVDDGVLPEKLPQVDEFLAYLDGRDVPVVVVSSHMDRNVRKEASLYGIAGRIMQIQGSVMDKGRAIEDIVRMYDVPKPQAAYLGDMSSDIESGNRAGVRTIGIPGYHTASQLYAAGPSVGVAFSLREVTRLVDFRPG